MNRNRSRVAVVNFGNWTAEDTAPCATVFHWRHRPDVPYGNCMHCNGMGGRIETCPNAEVIDE